MRKILIPIKKIPKLKCHVIVFSYCHTLKNTVCYYIRGLIKSYSNKLANSSDLSLMLLITFININTHLVGNEKFKAR